LERPEYHAENALDNLTTCQLKLFHAAAVAEIIERAISKYQLLVLA
jgi:hypothetical protein